MHSSRMISGTFSLKNYYFLSALQREESICYAMLLGPHGALKISYLMNSEACAYTDHPMGWPTYDWPLGPLQSGLPDASRCTQFQNVEIIIITLCSAYLHDIINII